MPTLAAIFLGLLLAAGIFLLMTAAGNEPRHRAGRDVRERFTLEELERQKAQWEQIWNTGADPMWTDQLGWIPTPIHHPSWYEQANDDHDEWSWGS
jgi:hypothetical protein